MKQFLSTVFAISILAMLSLCASAQTKDYRGEIGSSHIQMRLQFNGSAVTGTYFYDSVGQQLKLTGQMTGQGGLELKESDAKGKQTGKFVCKHFDDPIDSECAWTRADGTHESVVSLEPQHMAFTNGLEIQPKTIANRKTGVNVSYPEIFSKAPLGPAAREFNRRILE